VYMRKSALRPSNMVNNTTHSLLNPNMLVLDIKDDDETLICIINIYYAVLPAGGHTLHHLLKHKLCKNTLTVLVEDFYSHSLHWSISGRTPSSWATHLENWINANGFLLLNLIHKLTWFGLRDTDHPSCYVLTLPLLFLIPPRPFTHPLTRPPIPGTALP